MAELARKESLCRELRHFVEQERSYLGGGQVRRGGNEYKTSAGGGEPAGDDGAYVRDETFQLVGDGADPLDGIGVVLAPERTKSPVVRGQRRYVAFRADCSLLSEVEPHYDISRPCQGALGIVGRGQQRRRPSRAV